MTTFIHPQALCESAQVGDGTRVWAFAHVLPGAVVGRDCNLCDGVFVENDVRIGDRVTVKSGVQLWDGVTLEDDVFVGPNATFTNDAFPRSRQRPSAFLRTTIGIQQHWCDDARSGAFVERPNQGLNSRPLGSYVRVQKQDVATSEVPWASIFSQSSPGRW